MCDSHLKFGENDGQIYIDDLYTFGGLYHPCLSNTLINIIDSVRNSHLVTAKEKNGEIIGSFNTNIET